MNAFLSSFLSILLAVFVFGIMIFVHELGHFISARLCGVGVKEFAMGMGPRILSRMSPKTRIIYSLRLFPIGGFVQMVGEDEEVDDERALNRKPVWKRFIVLASGSAMNLLLGALVMAVMVLAEQNIVSTRIYDFKAGGITSTESGLNRGDQIIRVGDKNVYIFYDLASAVSREGVQPVDVTVVREGVKTVVPNVRFNVQTDASMNRYGVIDFYLDVEQKTFPTYVKQIFYRPLWTVDMVWSSIMDLVTGRYGVEAVSGPVGVTSEMGKAAKEGPSNFMLMFVIITMNLGVVNLLPLPALDGGRLVFLLIELVRRKPIKPEYEGYVHLAGIVVLLGFMVFVTYNDIVKLFTKG